MPTKLGPLPPSQTDWDDRHAREQERIAAVYSQLAASPDFQRRYSPLNPDALFALQQRERMSLLLLRRHGFADLHSLRLLEVGCGAGTPLLRWLSCGFSPENCAGIDLMPDRLERARARLPAGVTLRQADATQLPFPDGSFDVISQFTVFSSILDSAVRQAVAREMLRVLHPRGMILWYDFWLNPKNRDTRGIRAAEIRELFPHCAFTFRRITLAPPLARWLAPRSTFVCEVMERLKVFNSHYLVSICPAGSRCPAIPLS